MKIATSTHFVGIRVFENYVTSNVREVILWRYGLSIFNVIANNCYLYEEVISKRYSLFHYVCWDPLKMHKKYAQGVF